ncbi:MAG TPA: hypothetical protein VMB51_04085 [Solirubrobacteraceae bacterium]|nr:hypothetical protein [Solirubrobacteraceae bacterium]
MFEDCVFDDALVLREASFPTLHFRHCRLEQGIDAADIVVHRALCLDQRCWAGRAVCMDGARIGGLLDCSHSAFSTRHGAALSLVGANIGGDLRCCGRFRARGEVRVAKAVVAGEVDFTGARLYNPGRVTLFADNVRVAGRVACGPRTLFYGKVDMRRAEIGSQLRFLGRSIAPHALAWNLEAARVARAVVFVPEAPIVGEVNMTNATFAYLRDNDNTWAGGYELSGLEFGSLISSNEQSEAGARLRAAGRRGRPGEAAGGLRWWRPDPVTAKRIAWLGRNASGYQPQLYDQLAADYRDAGHVQRQRYVLIAKQQRRRAHLPAPARLWSRIEEWLLGFGYRSWQALIFVALLLVGGIIFYALTPKDVVPFRAQEARPPFWPAIYTVDLLVPFVSIAQREQFVTRHFGTVLATVLTVSGWLLLTAIIAGVTGFIRRTD